MNSSLYPIHLPLSEGNYALVYVKPEGIYDQIEGKTLIETYGVKPRVVKPKPIPSYDLNVVKTTKSNVSQLLNTSKEVIINLNLCKTLPHRITISGKQYDPKEIIVIIEQIQNCKLFSRRNNRLLKTAINLSFELKGFVTEENLMIVGRKESIYTIRGKND